MPVLLPGRALSRLVEILITRNIMVVDDNSWQTTGSTLIPMTAPLGVQYARLQHECRTRGTSPFDCDHPVPRWVMGVALVYTQKDDAAINGKYASSCSGVPPASLD